MADSAAARRTVSYVRMDEGTVEDYELMSAQATPFRAATVDRVLTHLELLKQYFFGLQVDRYEHSLQTATRASRSDECEELVVAAVFHDLGDTISPSNHEAIGAQVLRPYVSRYTFWMMEHHGIFQRYHFGDKIGRDNNERERFRGHPAFDMTERFCEHDQLSFDPHYDTLPLEHFEPMIRTVFARAPWGEHTHADWPA